MYNSALFTETWDKWKEHYKEVSGRNYSKVSEDQALSALFKKSHGVEQLAIDSINYSIEKNWCAVYIKPKENGNGKTNGGGEQLNGNKGTSGNRVDAVSKW